MNEFLFFVKFFTISEFEITLERTNFTRKKSAFRLLSTDFPLHSETENDATLNCWQLTSYGRG